MGLAEQGGRGNSGTTPLIFVEQKENRKRKRQPIADLINYQLVCVEIGFTQKCTGMQNLIVQFLCKTYFNTHYL